MRDSVRERVVMVERTAVQRSRREVLKLASLAVGSAAVSVYEDDSLAPAAEPASPAELAAGAIDAHSHVWTSDVETYPLAAPYKPDQMQPASFTPRQLLAE